MKFDNPKELRIRTVGMMFIVVPQAFIGVASLASSWVNCIVFRNLVTLSLFRQFAA